MVKEISLKSWVGISLFLLVMVSTAGAETTSLDANYVATSLVINSSDIFITNGYDVNIGTGGININGGLFDANSGVGGDSLIRLEGNWSNSGSFAEGSSTVDFDGAGPQIITLGGAEPNNTFNNITISGPNVTIGGFVQLSGNFVFKKTTSTFSTGGHDVNVAGDWNNNGIFNHDGGTVTFDGPSPQIIITGGTDPNKAFNNVRVTGAGVQLELFGQTLAGDFVFESTDSSKTNSQDVNVAGSLVILSGTLDANDSNISVGGDWTNNDTFSPGTSTVRFTGDSNSTIAGTNATTFHNLEIDKADVNDRLFIIIDGCGSSNKTRVNSGTLDLSNADVTFSCANDIEFSGLGLSGSVKLDVADMVIVSGDFVFESASTEDITGGIIRLGGSFSTASGADFSPSGGTVEFDGGSGAKIAGEASTTFHNLTIGKTDANVTLSLPLMIGNDLTINSSTLDANDHNLTVRGNWTNNDTFNPGNGTVIFDGTGPQTIFTGGIEPNNTFNNLRISGSDVTLTIAGQRLSGDFVIEKVTSSFSTGGNEIHIGGNWTNNGTFNHDGGSVFFEGLSIVDSGGTGLGKSFYNLELNGSGLTLSGNDLDVDGNLNISSGTLDANDSNIYVGGDWNAGGAGHTFNPSTGTVVFDGSGPQTIFPGDTEENNTFNNLRVDGSGLGVTLGGFVQLSGDFAIEKVTDTFSTGGNPIKVAGNWINNGTFNHDDAPVTLDGSGTFGPGSDPFDDLIVSSGTRNLTGSNLTVDGKLTITSTGTLQATTGGLDIYTGEGGATDVDIDGGLILQLGVATGDINWHVRKNSVVDVDPCATVILDGFDSSNRIKLKSSTDGIQWLLNDRTSDTNIPSINNVTVTDSDASSGETIIADDGTNDSTRTINWLLNTTFLVYVDDDAPGNNDGNNWTDAYRYLQDALADANASGKDIWVAAGSYKPDVNTSNAPGSGDREATFQLPDGLTIYGGFPSGGGTWEDRDPNAYKATLTGDLDGNDIGEPNHPSRGENSYHVVTITGANNITLDGFKITGGNANALDHYYGGGILCVNSPPLSLAPNIIVNNTEGIDNIAGSYTREGFGGGIALFESSANIQNNWIISNFAIGGSGAGIYVGDSGAGPRRCVIKDNVITGCGRLGTSRTAYGGGIAIDNNSPSQIVIKDNNISDNDANYGGGIYYEGSTSSPPLIINNNFISDNFADYGGGVYGGVYSDSSEIQLINCILRGNEAYYDGGGAFAEPNVSFAATNCVFSENSTTTGDGGGFYADPNATSTVSNCTLVSNSAANLGGGCVPGRHLIGNPFNYCIFWENTAITGSGESAQISGTDPVISHSCIQGWTGSLGGIGNIGNYPFLADIPDQVQLLSTSPCRDAGDNSLVPPDIADLDNDGNMLEPTPLDLAGRPRFADGDCGGVSTVDMGAYEFSSTYIGDFDGDCDIDFVDFGQFAPAWSTEEGDAKFDTTFDISTPQDDSIDMFDLDIFTENWLAIADYKTLHSAVIVGISDYNDIPDVNFGAEDANDWYSYLAGLGYENIWVYGDSHAANYPQYDGLATETNIKTALQNMVDNAEADDVIAFVFSGHGYGDGIGNSQLCTWDSNSGMYGEDGALFDHELANILQSVQSRVFVFLDCCFAGGMGDELMAMPNAANVYATTTCDPNGCRGEEPAYSNGAWNYWFLEAGLIGQYSSDSNTTMEECFTWADSQYNPGGDDEPAEFDGDGTDTFTLW